MSKPTPKPQPKPLLCGCIPGYFLCPEAVRLWSNVRMIGLTYTDEPGYRAAYNDYYIHVGDTCLKV